MAHELILIVEDNDENRKLEELPELLDGGVVDRVPPFTRIGGLGSLKGVPKLACPLVVLESLSQATGQGLLARSLAGLSEPLRRALMCVRDARSRSGAPAAASPRRTSADPRRLGRRPSPKAC